MSTVPLQSLDEIRRVIGDAPVYVSFDIDVLDPAFAPGTGTPERRSGKLASAGDHCSGCTGCNSSE